ncbi:MAG: T9SS type A sorting domain-containing protein [Bacteroidota bacterium]
MKIKTTLLMFMAMLLAFGSVVVNGQTEVWNQTHPTWNNTGTLNYNFRGIAYNPANNHIYVAGNVGGAAVAADNKVIILDAATGDSIDALTLQPLTLVEMGYGIKDVAVDDAGGIYAISTTQNRFHPLKLFYWANETTDPVQLWVDSPARYAHSLDFSAGFSVTGDFNSEALIVIPFQNEDSLYYFEASNGALGNLKLMGLGVAGHNATYAQVFPLGTKITDGFWYNNSLLQKPTLFDGAGAIKGSISPTLFTGTTGGAKQFTAGSKTYLEVTNNGSVVLIDITGAAADFSDVDAADIVATIPGTASPVSSIHGYGQEECALGMPDGSYVLYSFSGYRYTKKLATEAAPLAIQLKLDGMAKLGETMTSSYTFIDHNGDLEGTSEIKWYLSDDAQGTNKTEIVANANSATYTFVEADVDKYISFTVLPVALTGTVSFAGNLVESPLYGPVLSNVAAPVASNLAIEGAIAVYSTLKGTYTYSDENGDTEGVSILKWYTADDAAGTNMVEVATGNEYVVQPADENKYIVFSVTPVATTGGLLEGETVNLISSTAVTFPAFLPEATNLAISGRQEVAGILTGTYTYSDLNGDVEQGTVLQWFRADDVAGTNMTEVATGSATYTLVAADEGKFIAFAVTPVNELAETGTTVYFYTGAIAAEPAPEAPVASNVVFHGNPEVGVVVYGTYTYTDRTDDPEGASIHKWFSADDATGTNKAQITGADTYALIVTEDLVGKFLFYEITPVATTGQLLQGNPVEVVSSAAAIASTNGGDFERVWMRGIKAAALPEYMSTSTTERGFAVGEDHIYLASRYGGIKLIVADKKDGSFVAEMNTTGMDVGLFYIQDVEVSTDGQILACPLTISGPFAIYKWENELAAPTKFIEYTSPGRIDRFSVVGDVSADAVIYAALSSTNQVVRWVVTGGIVQEPVIITLGNTTSSGIAACVAPYSSSADANFIVAGRSAQPQVYDKDGNSLFAIEGVGDNNNQANSPQVFTYKGRTLAAFHEKVNGIWQVIIQDITGPTHITVGRTEFLATTNDENGDVDVFADDEYFHIYYMASNGGLGYYKGWLELPEFVYAESNEAGDVIYVQFSKDMSDAGYDGDGWTVLADGSAIAVDTIMINTTSADMLEMHLVSAITNGQTVTIEYDGSNDVAAFDAMPLNAFTAQEVVNIVGVAAPTASDVSISGTGRVGETLTASYTYADADGDLEGDSKYQWYYSSNEDGSGALKILGESDMSYVVSSDVDGKYVAFEVVPVALSGGLNYLTGEGVMSNWIRIIPTGIDMNSLNGIKAYPNPVSGMLTVETENAVATAQLIDVTGKLVRHIETNMESTLLIDMSMYQSGIYYLRLSDEAGASTIVKIVKVQ